MQVANTNLTEIFSKYLTNHLNTQHETTTVDLVYFHLYENYFQLYLKSHTKTLFSISLGVTILRVKAKIAIELSINCQGIGYYRFKGNSDCVK